MDYRYRYNYTNSCRFRQGDEGEKSRKTGKSVSRFHSNPVLCVEQACSTPSCAVIFAVDDRHERSCRKCQKEARTSTRGKTGVGKVDTLNIVVRSNISKRNMEHYGELYSYLVDFNKKYGTNLTLYPARMEVYHNSKTGKDEKLSQEV